MDPLSVTASLAAILQLSTSVTQYLKQVKGGSRERIKLREEIRNVAFMLQILNDRAEDIEESGEVLTSIKTLALQNGPLDHLKDALELLARKLAPQGRLRQLTQPILWPLSKGEVDAVLNIIERQKMFLSLAMENDTLYACFTVFPLDP